MTYRERHDIYTCKSSPRSASACYALQKSGIGLATSERSAAAFPAHDQAAAASPQRRGRASQGDRANGPTLVKANARRDKNPPVKVAIPACARAGPARAPRQKSETFQNARRAIAGAGAAWSRAPQQRGAQPRRVPCLSRVRLHCVFVAIAGQDVVGDDEERGRRSGARGSTPVLRAALSAPRARRAHARGRWRAARRCATQSGPAPRGYRGCGQPDIMRAGPSALLSTAAAIDTTRNACAVAVAASEICAAVYVCLFFSAAGSARETCAAWRHGGGGGLRVRHGPDRNLPIFHWAALRSLSFPFFAFCLGVVETASAV